MRKDGRTADEHRPLRISRGYQSFAEGSCVIELGNTRVLCAATFEEKVPPFMRGSGRGWVTAEYSMLPRSTLVRTPREVQQGRPSGRTQEIQRLIGRSLRAVTKLGEMGEATVTVDCDVLVADGGTRTAAITGAYIALYDAFRSRVDAGRLEAVPLADEVAAVSVGIIGGEPTLDLNYEEDVAAAVDVVRRSPSSLVPGPVVRARSEALEELEEARDLLASTRALATTLPSLAGAAGPRRYLFLAENPAELRGTGGLWGAYAIAEARDGRFSLSPFRPIQGLPVLPPADVPAPFPEYRRNYGQYGAPGYWVNINMTPDFPSAARAVLAAWGAIGRRTLDGVITADPFALRELLLVTGPVDARIPGVSVTADDVVPFLTNRAFARFTNPAQRKVVLGEAARAVVDRFLALEGRAMPRLQALARAVAQGHLKVFSSDPAVESALARAGVHSSLDVGGDDLSAVIVNAGAGGKVDFFATRTVRHDVQLVPGGTVSATTSVTIANDAPRSGQPRYVIGPHVGEAGDNTPLVAVYCGGGCRLVRAEREGRPVELQPGSELGVRFFRDYFTIPSGDQRTLAVTTEVPRAWTDAGSHGTYRLTIVGQTTIRPTRAVIRVRAPAGTRFVAGSDGVELEGGVATWRGVLEDRLQLELAVEKPPLLVRLWRTVTGDA
jgi:ribonuclease PH